MIDRPPGRRTPAVVAAAVVLGLIGASRIVYAGVVPLLPPIVTEPVPIVSMALGAVEIGAAAGIALVRFWAPPLGVAIALVELALTALAAPAGLVEASERGPVELSAVLLVGLVVPLLAMGFVLFVLLRRWPGSRPSA